jgi:putative ABC transport system permease protein
LNIVEGRGLRPEDTNVMVINNRLAVSHPELKLGRTVLLRIEGSDQMWQIAGIARQAFAGGSAYVNYGYLSKVVDQPGKTRNVRLVTAERSQKAIDQVKRSLEQNLAAAGIRATRLTSLADRRRVLDEHNKVIYTFLIFLAFQIVVVGGLGLMSVMSINVLERRREIGVLRAIGATRKKVLLIILVEGALIGLISWVIALISASLFSQLVGNFVANLMFHTDLDSAIDPIGILAWFLIVLLFGAVASFLPAWNASRMTVRQLVEYE